MGWSVRTAELSSGVEATTPRPSGVSVTVDSPGLASSVNAPVAVAVEEQADKAAAREMAEPVASAVPVPAADPEDAMTDAPVARQVAREAEAATAG
jgi:hypothetical protein